ncbi:MAG TPA: membrane protein insertase YidC [Cryomorphaceae bacterium]|nr:membrane protein insertase YidC [Cryomorphaceae bacterium]
MDKNSVIGLVLIGLLLIGYTLYQKPSDAEIAEQERLRDSIAAAQLETEKQLDASSKEIEAIPAEDATANDGLDSSQIAMKDQLLVAKYGALASVAEGSQEFLEVETELLKVKFSNKGGMPISVELKNYSSYDSLPLYVVHEDLSDMGYEFTYPSLGNFNTGDFYFTTTNSGKRINGNDEFRLVYTLPIEGNRKIEHVYTIKGDAYDIGIQTYFYDVSSIVTNPKLIWELSALHNEKGIEAERNNSSIFFKEEGSGRDYLSETGDDEEETEEPLNWLAFKQNFFSAALIGEKPFGKGTRLVTEPFPEENDSLTQRYLAEIPIEANADGIVFDGKLFYGPNDYKLLKDYGNEFDEIINLGWGIFGWVNKYIVIIIFDWLEQTGMSYGIIILILTLVIKMILSPLTFKNYLSSAKMRVLKPEIEELNEKHKDAEPMKKQQATMDLYRRTGVSPFAGCIPMVIQLPILYAMFRFFPSSIQLRHESFLWADDLSSYDSIASLPFTIPFYGDHVSLFTLLMAASTFVYTIYNSNQMPTQSQPGMPNMKVIMYIFPFMMLFFFNSFASGLSYYYFLANLISILQMLVIKKFFINEEKIKLQIAENKKKKGKQGKSKFQRKLEEMAKQRGIDSK